MALARAIADECLQYALINCVIRHLALYNKYDSKLQKNNKGCKNFLVRIKYTIPLW